MKRMMWTALVLILVILASWGASSYWFGLQTEREYHSMIRQASEWKDFHLRTEGYTRGIFSSEARTILEIPRPSSPLDQDGRNDKNDVPLTVTLTHQVSHGPVPSGKLPQGGSVTRPALAVIETRATLDPKTKELFHEVKLPDGATPTMDITTVLYWAGDSRSHARMQPIHVEAGTDSNIKINFTGLDSELQVGPDFKEVGGSSTMDTLEVIIDQELTIRLKGMKAEAHQSLGNSGLYLGDAVYNLELVDVKQQEPGKTNENFSMRDLQLKTLTRETGNDLSSGATFSIGRFALTDTILDKVVFELEARKLDAKVLSDLQDFMKELRREPAGAEAPADKSMTAFLSLLPRLLKNSPEVEIKQLGFASENGEVRASAMLKVDGKDIQDTLDPSVLVNAITVDAAVSVPKATVAQLVKSFAKAGKSTEEVDSEEDLSGTEEESSEELDSEKDIPFAEESDEELETQEDIPSAGEDESEEDLDSEEGTPSRTNQEEGLDNEIQSRLDALVAQKFVLLENGVYKSSVRFAQGRLTVNGQVINLDQLLAQ